MVPPAMLLCVDVGGTKTTLALLADARTCTPIRIETHRSAEVSDFGRLLADCAVRAAGTLDAVALGIAGPVVGTRVETTNLPWVIDADALSAELGVPVFLLNDLEALAWGIPVLADDALVVLNAGRAVPGGTIAVIAAGTGLGQAGLVWDGRRWLALASEGGHADFAPRSEQEIALLRHLSRRFEHVSWERVVSGPGVVNLFEFLRDAEGHAVPAALAAVMAADDPGAAITAAGLAGVPIASTALDLFVELYGAEAGNLALKLKAVGGVYVGGGIAPKILPRLCDGRFRAAFVAKGRFRALLEDVPVRVILDERTPLYGAARYAAERLADG
ncbi:MAG TPA: glucokinase [Candidatus Binatia bacterium]|nr:glucokinase [Candidatus Binatia bacterium]